MMVVTECSLRLYATTASEGARKYGLLFSGSGAHNTALSWMLGEMMTDAPRNTPEALGVVRFEPTLFVDLLAKEGPDVAREQIDELCRSNPAFASWLTVGDYLLFVRHGLRNTAQGRRG